MPNALLGGFSLGEKLYWIGMSEPDRGSRDRLVHGAVCKVMGSSSIGKSDYVLVQFPGNDVRINCKLTNLSRSPPPPLPGDFSLSAMVYYQGPNLAKQRGDRLVHGDRGEIMGPADGGKQLSVQFPGNKHVCACRPHLLSRSPPPPLPGGFSIGQKVYYTGDSKTLASGNWLVFGEPCEIMGPTDSTEPQPDQLNVQFPGRDKHVNCKLSSLSRLQPADHSPPEYPSMIQLTLPAATLGPSTSGCLGAYELQQGRMAHGRPVWKQPGQARCIAYLGGKIGWGVQPSDMVGTSSNAWLHLAAPCNLALPYQRTAEQVWETNSRAVGCAGWAEVDQLECVVLGPPPRVLQLGPDDPRPGCGLYELEVGRTVNGGPVWRKADGTFVVARVSHGSWVAQYEADCGMDKGVFLLLRASGSVPFPCDWGVWEATANGTWTPDPELRCLDVGPTPELLLMETAGCRRDDAKRAAGVYELQSERLAYGGRVWKQAASYGANAGWCIARLPDDLGWGVQPDASVGAPLGPARCCLTLRAPQLVYPYLESPRKWESLHENGRRLELSVKCINPPQLRFPIGTLVECSFEGGFERGRVVKHHTTRCAPPHGRWAHAILPDVLGAHLSLRRSDSFELTELMPYQVRLDRGSKLTYARFDDDSVIRAVRNQHQQVSLAAIVHHILHTVRPLWHLTS
jgi:hypothetical protein